MSKGKKVLIGLFSFLLTLLLIFILPLYFAYHSSLWEATRNISGERQAFLVIFGVIGVASLAKFIERKINGWLLEVFGGEEKRVVMVPVSSPEIVVVVSPGDERKAPEPVVKPKRFKLKIFLQLFAWVANGLLFVSAGIIRLFGGNGLESLNTFLLGSYSIKGVGIFGLIFLGFVGWHSFKESINREEGSLVTYIKPKKLPESLLGWLMGIWYFGLIIFGFVICSGLFFSFVLDQGLRGLGEAFFQVTIWEEINWILWVIIFLVAGYEAGLEKGKAWEKSRTS